MGEVAKEKKAVKLRRVVASNRGLLTALFERTYNSISPSAQRVFLLLSKWRVEVPEVALEALLTYSASERIDVEGALAELHLYSLIERQLGDDDEGFVNVQLAASEFGKKKLRVHKSRLSIEDDLQFLQGFGAGRSRLHGNGKNEVLARIENLVRAIANRVGDDREALDRELPVLESLGTRVPKAYLRTAELVMEVDGSHRGRETAKRFVRKYLETDDTSEHLKAWLQLADICRFDEDVKGEIHAVCEAALGALEVQDDTSLARPLDLVNRRLRELKSDYSDAVYSHEVHSWLARVCDKAYDRRMSLTATSCSRVAWLCLNIKDTVRALEITKRGLEIEPTNRYCENLYNRLTAIGKHPDSGSSIS